MLIVCFEYLLGFIWHSTGSLHLQSLSLICGLHIFLVTARVGEEPWPCPLLLLYRLDMLEDHSCLVSRAIQSSVEQESKWPFAKCGLEAVVAKGKRPLDSEAEEEESGSRKSSRLSDIMGEVQAIDIRSLSSLEEGDEQASDQQQGGDSPNAQIGEQQQGGDPPNAQTGEQQQGGDPPNAQIGEQQQGGDQWDTDNLIHPIGRDISINCLLHCSRAAYGSVASLNRGFRSLIRSGEIYKLRRMNGVVEHWVYFSCQLLEWVAFDPVARRWMNLPRMNVNECFMCSDKESLAVGTQLLLFGKEVLSHVMYKYNMLTNSWSLGESMNAPRCLFGSASLGHLAILAGGCDCQGNIFSSAELYDSERETWEVLPNMIKARKMCSGVFMDGKFYVIGGTGEGDSKPLTSGEEFDMETRTWKEIPSMSPVGTGVPRQNEMPGTEAPPLVAVVNNELYAADYADMEVRKYNKGTMTWSTIGKLPARAASMNGWGLAFRGCGDRLIVIGGPKSYGEGVIEVNSWVPNDDPPQWDLLVRKRLGSFVYNCAVMGC